MEASVSPAVPAELFPLPLCSYSIPSIRTTTTVLSSLSPDAAAHAPPVPA